MNQKAQATIEFILVLVIALTILTTISIPLTEFTGNTIQRTSSLTNLASQKQKISQTAESIALSGCGSKKIITVQIPVQEQAEYCAGLRINKKNITGHITTGRGVRNLTSTEINKFIKIDSPDKYTVNESYRIEVKKDCETQWPTEKFTIGANYTQCSPIV